MQNKKEDFYLFLDIDGVMWDWPWRIEEIKHGRIKKGGSIRHFNPESVEALNALMAYLNEDYNCNLVISSTWRRFMDLTLTTLDNNNVVLPQNVERTPFSKNPKQRGREILSYLTDMPSSDNILIIDDGMHDFAEHFSPSQIIKTNIYGESLRHHHINNWIKLREHLLDNEKHK
ncbi:MAG: hypothetical protein E7354_00645 [Clostridiales bacterium]|nr:hypothetical protein [Clostridiales bacterium]